MKANNGSGNLSERDEWETPNWLFDILNKQYNFSIDCCSTKNNTKCIGRFKDFLLHIGDNRYVYWINPPFSKAKEILEHFFKIVNRGVGIYRCDNLETFIWQKIIFTKVDWVFIPDKRIAYEGLIGGGCRFPSALFGVNLPPPKNINGTLLKIK